MRVSHSVGRPPRLFLKYESDYKKLTIRSRRVSPSFIFSEKSPCVHLCRVDSDYCDFLSFGLPLSPPHTQTDTRKCYTEIQRCTLNHPHHSWSFQMRGTVVMPQAAGHPVLQMNTLQYMALHLSVHSKTNKLLVCVCLWLCVSKHYAYFYQRLLT